MKKTKHIPSYLFLLSELVTTLEAVCRYRLLTPDNYKHMQRRLDELKSIDFDEIAASDVIKEIQRHRMIEFKKTKKAA